MELLRLQGGAGTDAVQRVVDADGELPDTAPAPRPIGVSSRASSLARELLALGR